MTYHHSTVARYQAMTSDQREQAVAAHVEALFELGWHWEGRGLVPTIGRLKTDPDSASFSNFASYPLRTVTNTVDPGHKQSLS